MAENADNLNKPEEAQEKAPKTSRFFTEYYASAYLFLIAAFILSAVFVHRPLLNQVKSLKAETGQKIEATQSQTEYLKRVEASVSAAQSIPQEILEQVDQALPTESDIPSILLQLKTAAERDNVLIDTVNFTEAKVVPSKVSTATTTPAGAVPVEIQLNIRARDYFAFKRFLSDIEGNLRLMDVVGVTAAAASASSKDLAYGLQLRTYIYPASEAK